ncbi:hypothetical protein PENSPDRAFT_58723 [Peniophora sp. CONT]|nr:hypothetical protein PENSPDRAFT_58723 [Peniophora sp. CONT]
MQTHPLTGGHGQHVASRAQQPSQPLGRTPSLLNKIVDRRNRHSLVNGLAVTASMGSTIAYGEPIPGAHEGDRPSSATVARAPPNRPAASVGRRDRPNPNECRLDNCSRRTAYVKELGGMIEWCSVEHISQGKYQPGSKACKMCKTNPRRWDNSYCCNACENHKG